MHLRFREQLLTTRYSRRLITLEKVARYDAAAAAAHHAAQPDPSMAIDRMRDLVLGPHERDAAGARGARTALVARRSGLQGCSFALVHVWRRLHLLHAAAPCTATAGRLAACIAGTQHAWIRVPPAACAQASPSTQKAR